MSETSATDFNQINEARLVQIAQVLAPAVRGGGVIHLEGALGAGKTTFARGLLRALGVAARVKSPTYSLIESYEAGELSIHHLDLYRIAAADELEWLGLGDLDAARTLWLIEWPERAVAAVPQADLAVHLAHAQSGRDLRFVALSTVGRSWITGSIASLTSAADTVG